MLSRRELLTGGLALLVAGAFVPETLANKKSSSKKTEKRSSKKLSDPFANDSDHYLLGRLLLGEAENCSRDERIAIAYTVVNRIYDGKEWNGDTLRTVALNSKQYSCFNKGDPNRQKVLNPENYKAFRECLDVARKVLNGKYKDPLNAAHYYNPSSANPDWASSKEMKSLGRIKKGKHLFFKEK